MNKGMLWFDNDPKIPIETKLSEAIQYYQNKYQETPNACFVNPKMFPNPDNRPITLCGVEIKPNRSILPNHFWIGVAGIPTLKSRGCCYATTI